MTTLPLHPLIVHFPLALALIMPVLTIVVVWMIKKGKFTSSTWLVIVGLQAFMLATGYAALQTGERDEDIVERVTGKPPIHEHEERAEMFIAATVATTAVATMAHFLKPGVQFYVQLGTVVLMLFSGFLGLRAGEAGGELVYKYGAPNAYIAAGNAPKEEAAAEGLLPTPGMNTSESDHPIEEADGSHEGDEAPAERDENEDVEPTTPVN